MTDYEIAVVAWTLYDRYGKSILEDSVLIYRDNRLELTAKNLATTYFLRKANAIKIDVPELSDNRSTAIAQIALAIGRRLERFERGRKSNEGRTAEQKSASARKAIQARWQKREVDESAKV